MIDFEETFNDSYERILGLHNDGDVFIDKFYGRFTSSSPEVKEKFKNTNMENQKKMLKQSLFQMMTFYTTKRDSDYMRDIASIHGKKGRDIPPELYELWLESLLETVKEMDPKYDREVGLAWKMILSMGITYMKDMVDRE
jgi:hemoglobin-like flavoprotein